MARRGRKAKVGAITLAGIGHSQAEPALSEIDNPLYNRAHDGETWNPKKTMAVKNMKESALVVLEQRKLIDEAQAKAGERFPSDLGERLAALAPDRSITAGSQSMAAARDRRCPTDRSKRALTLPIAGASLASAMTSW